MARELEVELINRWETLYRQLLKISVRQLNCVEKGVQSEDFTNTFADFITEWTDKQNEIEKVEKELKQSVSRVEMLSVFKARIEPLLVKSQDNINQAGIIMERAIAEAGAAMRSAKDHRHALQAYYGLEQESHIPIFFDEKK